MDKNIKKVNEILVDLFNSVLKMEEAAIRESSEKDLSITEVHTLVAIGRGRPKTMTHVANLLEINVSTLTTAINKLVKKGYVERLRDEDDRRIVRIHLTESGSAAVEAHENFHEEMIGEALAHIPDEEMSKFISSIDNINRFMRRKNVLAHERTETFNLKPISIGPHKLEIPIVSAGMGMRIGGSSLAAAVANEGGLGLIGSSEIGYGKDGYKENPVDVNLEILAKEIKTALDMVKEAGGKGLIGVSIMWNSPAAHQIAEVAVKAGAQVIVTAAAIPTDLPKYCGSKKVALVPTVSSKRVASAIIRSWTSKYNRTPDGFIYQGPLAAGLMGFKEAEIDKVIQQQYKLVSDIKSELVKLENCPLIAGGGIYSRDDAEGFFRSGADAFLMGTRFVATYECDADDEYKKLYLNCTSNDVTIIKSPIKTTVRAMKNSFTEAVKNSDAMNYDITEMFKKSVEGDCDEGLVFCSAGIDKIDKICSVKDIFRDFTMKKG